MDRRRAFLVGIAGVIATIAAAAPGSPEPARIAAAVLLGFVLPGAVIIASLFPAPALGRLETAMLVVGSSVTTMIIGGLLLNLTHIGVELRPLALLLGVVTAFFGIIAGVRAPHRIHRVDALPRPNEPRRPLILFSVAGLAVIVAFGMAVWGATAQPGTRFTELWAIPAPGSDTVVIGIRNMEDGTRTYTLQVSSGGQVIGSWPIADLAAGATWTRSLTVTAPGTDVDRVVGVDLFVAGPLRHIERCGSFAAHCREHDGSPAAGPAHQAPACKPDSHHRRLGRWKEHPRTAGRNVALAAGSSSRRAGTGGRRPQPPPEAERQAVLTGILATPRWVTEGIYLKGLGPLLESS